MAIHRPISEPGIYFITFTCHQWLPLIELTDGYDLVYDWFDILSGKGHAITGFVIMPNHLHLVLNYSGLFQSLNTLVGNGKRFMACEIIKRLKNKMNGNYSTVCNLPFRPVINAADKNMKFGKMALMHSNTELKNLYCKKIHYTHNNPCAGKWKLVMTIELYRHSSALFYLNGDKSNYPLIKDYRDFL